MKFTVKELQALDVALNLCSENKFKMVINYEGKLVSGDFLQYSEGDIVEPRVSHLTIRLSQPNNKNYFYNSMIDYLDNYLFDSNRFLSLTSSPRLLFNKLIKIKDELIKENPLNKFPEYEHPLLHNVNFLESNTTLDYIYLNPNIEYEVISVIQ